MSPRLLRATAGHVAVLPAGRPRRRSRIPWLLVLSMAAALLALLLGSEPVRSVVASVLA